ncbi:unnamed protein product [Phyllotreta striolata]|uniref:Uncharacterized protein n=1 Tax=Phyllotreta striolata TaxID=444603 RepID=A0A9N9TI60_PHYSR|nr:unnamed protein product [Phyllotreta striolata]
MGLFSGFRAKFTRDAPPKKSKKTLQTGVVALNIKFTSEFDLPNSSSPTSNGTKPTTYRIPLARSETFESNRRNLLEKLKSKSLTNISPSESKEPELPTTAPKKSSLKKTQSFQQPRVSTEEPNSTYVEPNSPVKKSNSAREISRTSQEDEYNYTYTDPSDGSHTYEKIFYNEDPSPLIMMTQHEPEIRSPDFDRFEQSKPVHDPEILHNNTEDFDFKSEPVHVPEIVHNNDEDFDFKINVVQHDRNYTSEDELSYVEDESPYAEDEQPPSFVGYSSQAANIFFGGGADVPPAARPRRNKLQIRSDSYEEMDC